MNDPFDKFKKEIPWNLIETFKQKIPMKSREKKSITKA